MRNYGCVLSIAQLTEEDIDLLFGYTDGQKIISEVSFRLSSRLAEFLIRNFVITVRTACNSEAH